MNKSIRHILVDDEKFDIPDETINVTGKHINRFEFIEETFKQFQPKIIGDLIQGLTHRKSQRRLTQQELLMVKLNQQSYLSPESRINIGEWQYLSFFSGIEIATYRNGNNIIVVFKGTSNKRNVITDLLLYHNISDLSFTTALLDFDKVKNSFPGVNIFVSGHSLGGTKALFVSSKRFVRGTVFNSFMPNRGNKMYHLMNGTPLVIKFVNRDDQLSNNAVILNPTGLVVMVMKVEQRGLFEVHTINSYINPDWFIY